LNTAVKYFLLLPLAIELCKNSITLDTMVHKNVPILFVNQSIIGKDIDKSKVACFLWQTKMTMSDDNASSATMMAEVWSRSKGEYGNQQICRVTLTQESH